jgi:excisionase family DNA binding protein
MKNHLLIENMTPDGLRSLIHEAVAAAKKQDELKETEAEPIRLTADQAAEYLGISKGGLYNLRYKGRIPHHKPPGTGRLIFYREELDQWIKQGGREEL